jgi:hypothetical protein
MCAQSLQPMLGLVAAENCVAILSCCIVHRCTSIFFLTYSESSWPDGSNHISFGSLCLSEPSNPRLKMQKRHDEFSGARNQQKPLRSFFAALNSYCLSQDRHMESKTGMVRTGWSWGFWICQKFFSGTSSKETARQKVWTYHRKSVKLKHICVLSGVLACETSARAPDRRTENCCLHTMLVFQENQGPL